MDLKSEIENVVSTYDLDKITIGVLGSHSAEEVGVAAKSIGLKTVVVCQKHREALYTKFNKHLFDYTLVLDKFKDIIHEKNQSKLKKLNTVFIPNRSFSVYVGYDNIEQNFHIPIYGNRRMLRIEDRAESKSQYWLLEKAGLRTPKKFSDPDKIDRLAIVKVQQKHRPLERAFFYVSSREEYNRKAEELIKKDIIEERTLHNARIEEYVLGQKFNANFQGWALVDVFGEFDFVGFDDRKQINLHGFLDLPARDQLSIDIPIKNEEIGHYGLTMRESQKPLVYQAAEAFRIACKCHFPPGMIGLFALQGAIGYDSDDPFRQKLAFYIFDVSPRIPGCPCVGPTSPEMRRISIKYSKILHKIGYNEIRTPMDLPLLEIQYASLKRRLEEIVT